MRELYEVLKLITEAERKNELVIAPTRLSTRTSEPFSYNVRIFLAPKQPIYEAEPLQKFIEKLFPEFHHHIKPGHIGKNYLKIPKIEIMELTGDYKSQIEYYPEEPFVQLNKELPSGTTKIHDLLHRYIYINTYPHAYLAIKASERSALLAKAINNTPKRDLSISDGFVELNWLKELKKGFNPFFSNP